MGGRGGDGGVARVSEFLCFFFFQKNPSLKKNCSLFEGVKVRLDLASESEFVLQRIQN